MHRQQGDVTRHTVVVSLSTLFPVSLITLLTGRGHCTSLSTDWPSLPCQTFKAQCITGPSALKGKILHAVHTEFKNSV